MLVLVLGEGSVSVSCCWVDKVLWRSVVTVELVKEQAGAVVKTRRGKGRCRVSALVGYAAE